jgi:hypothetical protein
VTGDNWPVFWGFHETNFVFWIGISHAGTLISAILRIVNATWRRPVTRSGPGVGNLEFGSVRQTSTTSRKCACCVRRRNRCLAAPQRPRVLSCSTLSKSAQHRVSHCEPSCGNRWLNPFYDARLVGTPIAVRRWLGLIGATEKASVSHTRHCATGKRCSVASLGATRCASCNHTLI